MIARHDRRRGARRASHRPLRLLAAFAHERGFLIVYERSGVELNLADVYELTGMAVVA